MRAHWPDPVAPPRSDPGPPAGARRRRAGRRLLVGLALAASVVAAVALAVRPHDEPALTVLTEVERPAAELPPQGFPGPGSTGVPVGTALRPSHGLRITRAGTVVDGLDVDGCITVAAPDVTIRRTRVRCDEDRPVVRVVDRKRGLSISDSELDGRGRATVSTDGPGLTLTRVDMHSSIDGPRLGDDTVVEGSWVHDLARVGSAHSDALQTLGAARVVIRGNSLQAYDFRDRDPHNAVLMLSPFEGATVDGLLVEGNYLDGGNVSVNVSGPEGAFRDVLLRDNVFGPNSRYGVALKGGDRGGVTFATTNTWASTGKRAR